MQTSIYIAKLMGPIIGIAGIGFLVNRQAFSEMVSEFLNSSGVIVMSGMMALLLGLVMVNAHNVWVADWPVIITIFGWLALIGGIMRITMTDTVRSIARTMLSYPNAITIEAIILIGLGAWLTYIGYVS